MKKILLGVFMGMHLSAYAQQSDLKTMIASTVGYLDKSEEYSDKCTKLLKKCTETKDKLLAKKLAEDARNLILLAKEQSDLAEKLTDQIEIEAKKLKCFNVATEADDTEDYCRQLGYHTFEISIYTKKAMNESELVYIQEYIFKAQSYADMAYQCIKNARLELDDAIKDLEECN